jgi:hypothetical protein
MIINWGFVIIIVAAVMPSLALFAAISLIQKKRKLTEKPPQTVKLLRPPGYSLSLKFDEVFEGIFSGLMKTVFLGTMCGLAGYMLWQSWTPHLPAWCMIMLAVLFGLFIGATIMATRQVFKNFELGRNLRLGLRGEQAVAEALAGAGLFGFQSFHDICDVKVGNIDHVTVGPRGVFLIETKARRRRPSRNGQKQHEITYDGKALQFPYGGRDPRPIEQAQRSAKWLSNFLEKETGNPVWVEPIVVLPGWYVDGAGDTNFPVKVMNADYLVKYLEGKGQTKKIESDQVKRIVNALDKRCRDIEF